MSPEKLVRDLIPELIRQNGDEPRVRIANDEEMDELLRLKIVEEARELLESGNTEEIADVLEVIHALLDLRGISLFEIERVREEKRSNRGAFVEKYILTMDE